MSSARWRTRESSRGIVGSHLARSRPPVPGPAASRAEQAVQGRVGDPAAEPSREVEDRVAAPEIIRLFVAEPEPFAGDPDLLRLDRTAGLAEHRARLAERDQVAAQSLPELGPDVAEAGELIPEGRTRGVLGEGLLLRLGG